MRHTRSADRDGVHLGGKATGEATRPTLARPWTSLGTRLPSAAEITASHSPEAPTTASRVGLP